MSIGVLENPDALLSKENILAILKLAKITPEEFIRQIEDLVQSLRNQAYNVAFLNFPGDDQGLAGASLQASFLSKAAFFEGLLKSFKQAIKESEVAK